jgi:hypothetical protein
MIGCGLALLIFSQCKKAEVPAFIHIPAYVFQVRPGEGTANQKITEAWVYNNEQLLGIYDLPAVVPFIQDGNNNIQIFPGIKNNGLSDSRIKYVFCPGFDTIVSVQPGDSVSVTPKFEYFEQAVIEELGFESGNFLVSMPGNNGTFSAITDPNVVFEGTRCGKGVIDASQSRLYFMRDENLGYSAGNYYFLEMNYSANNKFSVGLLITEGGIETKYFALIINSTQTQNGTPNWNKIYVDFGDLPSKHPQATSFKFFVEMIPDESGKACELYLDNLKWVQW